jgi:ketosteroid isomerase-like protein
MSVEDNKALMRSVVEALNRKDLGALAEHLHREYVWHRQDGEDRDRERTIAGTKASWEAMPKVTITVHEMIAEGDRVVLQSTMAFEGVGEFPWVDVVRIQEGAVREEWDYWDVTAAKASMK